MTKYRQIAIAVLSLHFAILLALTIDHWLTPHRKLQRPLLVRSIAPVSSPTLPLRVQKQPSQKPSLSPPSISTPAKKPAQQKKQIQPSKIEKSPNSTVTSSAPTPQSPLPQRSVSELKIPAPLSSKSLEVSKNLEATIDLHPTAPEEISSYGRTLITLFQQNLALPEMGQVIARITVQSPGQLASIEILDLKSAKNALWLKNQLPLLELPCFNDFSIKEFTLDFTIAFRNEEDL